MNRPGPSSFFRAFTLVELMVSLAVILVLTTILLARYPETAIRLSLVNASHTTALLVREAQVRGSAIDSVNSSLGGYGVYIALSKPDTLILFGDTVDSTIPKPFGIPVGNGLYESGSPINETKTTTTLPSGYVISKLCVGNGFPFTCNTSNAPVITSLIISFTRPNPIPSIYINNSTTTANIAAACIELRSPRAPLTGHVRTVQVFNSGMITTTIGKCDNSLQ
jgi:prepilin-type N-terminal cleavage/methylation domain-containing protein